MKLAAVSVLLLLLLLHNGCNLSQSPWLFKCVRSNTQFFPNVLCFLFCFSEAGLGQGVFFLMLPTGRSMQSLWSDVGLWRAWWRLKSHPGLNSSLPVVRKRSHLRSLLSLRSDLNLIIFGVPFDNNNNNKTKNKKEYYDWWPCDLPVRSSQDLARYNLTLCFIPIYR